MGMTTGGEGVVVAVDGGGSKTDAAVVDAGTGRVLGRHRGPPCSHHEIGADRAAAVIDEVVTAALAQAQVPPGMVVHAGAISPRSISPTSRP